MKIQTDGISLYVEVDETLLNKGLIPALFLHGFTGSSQEWKFILKRIGDGFIPFAVDIIGHGKSDSPDNEQLYTAESISKQIDTIITKLGFTKVIICGYSMGGRAALSYCSNYPDKVMGLILESTTPGIEEEPLRKKRIENDGLLIERIKRDGVEQFCRYWLNLPLFESLKSLPQEEFNNLLDLKSGNNPVGLSNSLKGFGTGTMPALWKGLWTVNFPVLLITGEYDDKFTGINEKVKLLIGNSIHKIIKDCGHNTHLEKPEEFINLVNKYLSDNYSGKMK
jgi:2-succinyl-6-hydroxy-2,4-cyclohexadiene-1-carboxylate synthase